MVFCETLETGGMLCRLKNLYSSNLRFCFVFCFPRWRNFKSYSLLFWESTVGVLNRLIPLHHDWHQPFQSFHGHAPCLLFQSVSTETKTCSPGTQYLTLHSLHAFVRRRESTVGSSSVTFHRITIGHHVDCVVTPRSSSISQPLPR